jgi:hypothetical protein
MCAGGVGITPLVSLLFDIHRRHLAGGFPRVEAVHLIWVSRYPSPLTHWWSRQFVQIINTPGFHIHLCTAELLPRRPDLRARAQTAPLHAAKRQSLELRLMLAKAE